MKNPKRWYQGKHHYTDPHGRFIFTWGASPAYVVAINTNLVKPEQIKSYWDLLDPKWKGKIVARSPARRGAAASSVPMLLNPKRLARSYPDARSREVMQKTVDFFEQKGKRKLKEDDIGHVWYADFLEFVKRERVFATLLTPFFRSSRNG